jgi:Tol biopolymer transport system component
VSAFLGANYDPAISPNGKYLAYTSTAGGNEDIWVVDLAKNERWQLTQNSLSDYSPCFSGNGENGRPWLL